MSTPERTRALIVGIDQHHQSGWNLHGPVADAVRFAAWLRTRNVPVDNIHLFLSATERSTLKDLPAGISHAPATRAEIRHWLTGRLPELAGDNLIVFWGGHGIIERDYTRRLLYADATEADACNLELGTVLAYLRSNRIKPTAFNRQFIIVDACADYSTHFKRRLDFPRDDLVLGEPQPNKTQIVFLAASRGQKAINLDGSETGLFSRELLKRLPAAGPWPFDHQILRKELITYFTTLRNDQQIPAFLEYQGDVTSEAGSVGHPPCWQSYQAVLLNAAHHKGLFSESQLLPLHQALTAFPPMGVEALRKQILAALGQSPEEAADIRVTCWKLIYGTCDSPGAVCRLLHILSTEMEVAVTPDIYTALDGLVPLGFSWAAHHRLLQIVRRLPDVPTRNQILGARRDASDRMDLGPDATSPRHLLSVCTEELALLLPPKDDHSAHALNRFLRSVNASLPQPSAELTQWYEDVFGVAGIIQRGRVPATLPVAILQITLHPALDPLAKENRYQPAVQFWPDGLKEQGCNLSAGNVSATHSAGDMENLVHQWIEQAVLQIDPAQELRVEMVLPASLFDLTPDEWTSKADGHAHAIGLNHLLVLRSRDRFANPGFRQALRDLTIKWRLLGEQVEARHCQWSWNGNHAQDAEMKSLLTKQVLLAYSPTAIDPPAHRTDWLRALKSGLPLVFWLRGNDLDRAQRPEIEQALVGQSPLQWPARAKQLRRERQLRFSLLWDDPENPPHGSNYQLTAPT